MVGNGFLEQDRSCDHGMQLNSLCWPLWSCDTNPGEQISTWVITGDFLKGISL